MTSADYIAKIGGFADLQTAIHDLDYERVSTLLAADAATKSYWRWFIEIYGIAVDTDDEAMIRLILATMWNKQKYEAESLFRIAAGKHSRAAVSILLDAGVDINHRYFRNMTPLFVAIENAPGDFVHFLVSRGANVHLHAYMETLLHHAVRVGAADGLKALLDCGVAVDERSVSQTPLLYSVDTRRDIEKIQLLLDYGANVHAKADGDGVFCLKIRDGKLAKWHRQVVLHLVDAGGDIDQHNRTGGTLLDHALCANAHIYEKVRFLLACGATKTAFRDRMPAIAANEVARERFDFIRWRVFQICVALQNLRFPALVTLHIIDWSWSMVVDLVPMHQKWNLIVAVKHFRERKEKEETDRPVRQSATVGRRNERLD